MAAVTSVTARQEVPNCTNSVYVITYSKGATGDTLDIATYTPIKTILFAVASDDGAGAEDPLAWSGTTITFSAGTGAGRLLLIGSC